MLRMVRKIAIVLLLVCGGVLLWGNGIEPRWIEETRHQVRIAELPAAWQGATVAFLADLQVGMFLDNEGTIRQMVERVAHERPALVLIGGDFVYHPTEDDTRVKAREEFEAEDTARVRALIEDVVEMVRPLAEASIPSYAVFGNHDYAMQTKEALKLAWVAAELAQALEAAGIQVLHNEAAVLKRPGAAGGRDQPLYLAGIGAHYPDEDRVQKALAAIPEGAPRLVLMHNPQSFAHIPAGAAPLAVAGHTHGGQVRIPYLPTWSWISIVREGEIHADGWIQGFGAPGNRLYVNRGIGFSLVPLRINCRPELTFFTLVK